MVIMTYIVYTWHILDIVRNNDDNNIVIMHKFHRLKEQQVTIEGQNDKLISEDFNSFVQ